MTLTFLPRQESFSIEFDPTGAYNDRALDYLETLANQYMHQEGSLKAPLPTDHFYAEVRLNPDKRVLLLRPQSRLTRFASDWVLKCKWTAIDGENCQYVYVVDYADRFAMDVYKLMDWENRLSYTVSGLTVSPPFVAAMSDRSSKGYPITDTIMNGDYYFHLNHAVLTNRL